MNLKNKIRRFFQKYEKRYIMPKEFLLQLSVTNVRNVSVVAHFIFAFACLALAGAFISLRGHYGDNVISFVNYSYMIFYSSVSIIWAQILKRKRTKKPFVNDVVLLFFSLSCLNVIGCDFFIFGAHFRAILLLAIMSVLLLVLFDIEPLFFLVISPGITISACPIIYKDFGVLGVVDLSVLCVVIICLAYHNRHAKVKYLLKNEMLKIHKEGLQLEVEQQIAEIDQKNDRIIEIQNNTIIGLSNLVENRDTDTGEHVRRTAAYVGVLTSELLKKGIYKETVNQHFVDLAVKAAPMHDIGKIKISDDILKKPGRLTEAEFEMIKLHTTEGSKIVRDIIGTTEEPDYVKIAQEIVSGHHEKWDGHGYPKGLKGEEIPLSARIMAVADVFDALVSERCYKSAYSVDEAFEILEKDSGSHFDPTLVPIFIELRSEIEQIMERYKD